ncbi:MAG TPA: flagellar basal-body rod protein FlgF [Bradyrhizobium sp.]|nr:flagellar basal-body rod protein FlgF [Bradyrhizobium sp.]
MQNTLLIGLSRQVVLERQMDVVANNVANVNTTGYKADRSLFIEHLMSGAHEDNFAAGRDRRLSYVNDRATFHDFSQGAPEQTKNPLDVAIDGSGFFVVQTPAGERYTRDGSFQINNQGQLVNASGYPVLGSNGPVQFQQTDKQINIAADGSITVIEGTGRADSVRGKLRLVSFAQAQRLTKEGANLYAAAAADGATAAPDTASRVRQGFVEKSNVNSVAEMSRMIEVTRTYTQISTLLQQQSDLHKSAIDKLADVPA